MSSPVHHPDDLDAALRYAPPWARKTETPGAASPGDPGAESPSTSPTDDYDDGEPSFDGDRAMLELRHRLSLDPDQEPEPPVRIDDRPTLDRIALRLCAVAGVAALVAWATISLPVNVSLPIKISLPIKPQIEPVAQATVPPAAVTTALTATPIKVVHIHAAMPILPVATVAPVAPATPAPSVIVPTHAAEATPKTAAAPPEAAPAAERPQPAEKAAALAPDEIAMLVKRGKDLLMSGDISAARLLLRRAAEAGDAEAALAFGSTFDPAVIARLGAIGVEADAVRARKWYERAAALGSNRASEQIANLAAAGR